LPDIPDAPDGGPDPRDRGDPPVAQNIAGLQIIRTAVKLVLTAAAVLAIFAVVYELSKKASPEPDPTDRASMSRAAGGYHEWRQASADHEVIAAAVAACSRIYDLSSQPDYVREELRLDILPSGKRNRQSSAAAVKPTDIATAQLKEPAAAKPREAAPAKPKPPTELMMSNYMRAAIYLSDSITRARVEAAANAHANYNNMFWFQLLIVGIGAVTTILISIKSMVPSGNAASRLSLWIGIAAIIFSSIGTAIAASNSFFGPREAYLRNERSLGSLRQLHSDIASHIASAADATDPQKCPKLNPASKDDPFSKQIQDWSSKFGAIVNATDTGSSSASVETSADQSNH
jgi:hypothetical protein